MAQRLWLRRCSAALAFPAFVVIIFVVILSRPGWEFEWGWALSHASTATLLLGPLLAGLVAFDRSRRAAPTLEELAGTVPRPRLVAIALMSWLWCVLAWVVGVAFVAVRVTQNGAADWPDPWILVQAPVVLLAAAACGLAWGSTFKGVAAGPVIAIIIFVSVILTDVAGMPALFAAGRATGSLIGVEQIPSVALSGVALNLTVALLAVLWSQARTQPVRRKMAVATKAAAVLTVGGALAYAGTLGGGDTYRVDPQPRICVGSTLEVCGPADGRPVLSIAQRDLASATSKLSESGIAWRDRYVMAKGNDVLSLSADEGLLRVSTENIEDGRLSRFDVAATLAMPRLCQEYASVAAGELLEEQGKVFDWVTVQLRADTPAPASPEIMAAYDAIAQCEPARSRPS